MYKLYPNNEKMYNTHNRNLSVATNFSNYHRLSNGEKRTDGERKSEKVKVNHGRALSAMGVKGNNAFFEANNYIINRKNNKIKGKKKSENSKSSYLSEVVGNDITNINSVSDKNNKSSLNENNDIITKEHY